jgi:DNA invertase Pin-like site-specific DNA recombinase
MKLIGYIRVSTDDQAEFGVSLADQISRLRAWAQLHGHELVDVFEDRGLSGKSLDRLGLRAALSALEEGRGDGLIVTNMDRLTRSVLDVLYLVDVYFGPTRGYGLVCIDLHVDTSTPTGRMQLSLLAVVAQWQREEGVERVRQAMAHKKAQGKRVGGIPWGYRLAGDGETLVPHPKERQLLMLVLRLRREEKLTLREIAAELKRRGWENRNRSRNWNPSSIRGLLRAAEQYEGSDEKRWEDEEAAYAAEVAAALRPEELAELGR